MHIYAIRHAIAEPLGKNNDFSDEKRALTKEGRDRMREAARALRRLGVEFDLIFSSPLPRAVETAEIIGAAVGLEEKSVIETRSLAPGASVDELFAEIKSLAGAESIALVGHQPDLGKLISGIIGGDDSLSIELKKGSVCCINVTETVPAFRGELMWLMTPRQLRLVGRG